METQLLLEYRNPKDEYHEKIDTADLMRDDIIVAIIPRMLHCEMCDKPSKFVWEDPKYMRDDGTFIRHCRACAILLDRFSKYTDEQMALILEA